MNASKRRRLSKCGLCISCSVFVGNLRQLAAIGGNWRQSEEKE